MFLIFGQARAMTASVLMLVVLCATSPAGILGLRSSHLLSQRFRELMTKQAPEPAPAPESPPAPMPRLAPNSTLLDLAEVASSEEYVFLHIPKTGGTSVEKQITDSGAQVAPISVWADFAPYTGQHNHTCVQHGFLSPWHMTSEQAERCKLEPNLYDNKLLYCMIRDPVDRLLSELFWRKSYQTHKHPESFYDYLHFGIAMKDASREEEMLTFANAVAFFVENLERETLGTEERAFTESILHLQPQAWYVFGADGRQTCDKVGLVGNVRFRVTANTSAHHNQHISPALRERLKGMLWKAYQEDFELVQELERMLAATSTPAPAPSADKYDSGEI